MVTDVVGLMMSYNKLSGRWLIKTTYAPHGPALQFPDRERIEALWKEYVSGGSEMFVGNELLGPTRSFYVDIGGGSTQAERQKFLTALLAGSSVVQSELEPPLSSEIDALCET